MDRANLTRLKPPKRRIETRVLLDPDHPGEQFPITLGSRNFVTVARAQEAEAELIGEWVEREDGERPALPIPVEEGEEAVYPDRVMCSSAAAMWALQAGPEEGRYSPNEMLIWQVVAHRSWEAAIGFSCELNAGEAQHPGNASGAATGASSPPRSPKATSTRRSATTSRTRSGA